jgi:hypothetical protein
MSKEELCAQFVGKSLHEIPTHQLLLLMLLLRGESVTVWFELPTIWGSNCDQMWDTTRLTKYLHVCSVHSSPRNSQPKLLSLH